MSNIRLSIIIPFYNVEKYIAECLDSVFDQDIPLEEYEVICVNDGSPDHSREVVLDYMKRYPNLHLVEHDHNRKLGAARNTGRSVAKGTYIWNVDSDDMIAPKCLGGMLQTCEQSNLDVLMFSFKILKVNRDLDDGQTYPKGLPLMTGLEFLQNVADNKFSQFCPVWKQLYRKQFLDDNKIYSPPINMGEDVPYSFSTLLMAKKLLVIPEMFYVYRLNEESLTGSFRKLSPPILYEKCIVNSKYIYDILQFVPCSEKRTYQQIKDIASYTLGLCAKYFRFLSRDEKKEFWTLCKNNFYKNYHIIKLINKRAYIKYLIHIIRNE